ncbi:hsp90 co-chaperone cdc37 [Rhodotorula toruloides]|uniref:Hsp90 chaperone protein kinase-targeting subunit n=1 Tax=Rhodotorula toruloides TaxID=5286 RepID=A0A511KA07_RHOTO|nr:hsp90 co-chaperone cdc37 [Rhodotorula toruloides]
MSRLNYNKWDNLQLSDDSDIEVHPNVDKRSMIRWKQRDIHEKREQRKLKLKQFETEVPMNDSLIQRIDGLVASTKAEGAAFVAKEVLRLKAALPYKYEEKKFANNEQPSEDHMIVSLLSQVITAVQKKEQENAGSNVEAARADRLVKELEWHKQRMVDRQKEIEQEKEEIEREQKKWITSEDIRPGWDSKTIVSLTPSAQPKPAPPTASSSKGKQTETVIETLNSPGVAAAAAAEAPRQAVSADPSLLTEETGDALMVEAFSQAMKGTKADEKRATECIEKALVGQYCRSLGRDGVALFFQRMTNSNHAALQIFLDDVAKTSDRIISRAKVVAAERAEKAAAGSEGVEQIQLVPASPDQTITFEIPDGPPPENLEITGEGAEELDPQLVRDFLQKRWDIFQAFPKNLKAALSEKSLDKVNKVLGRMSVEEAEIVVEQLQEAGILSFETPGIVDQTGTASQNPTVTPKDGTSGSVPVQQTEVLNLEDSLD